jgi:hypothetical protein
MALTEKQRDILRLIQRSKPEDDGWYHVSKILWPIVNGVLPPDLLEAKVADEASDSGGFIRFTDRGRAVSDYL